MKNLQLAYETKGSAFRSFVQFIMTNGELDSYFYCSSKHPKLTAEQLIEMNIDYLIGLEFDKKEDNPHSFINELQVTTTKELQLVVAYVCSMYRLYDTLLGHLKVDKDGFRAYTLEELELD